MLRPRVLDFLLKWTNQDTKTSKVSEKKIIILLKFKPVSAMQDAHILEYHTSAGELD